VDLQYLSVRRPAQKQFGSKNQLKSALESVAGGLIPDLLAPMLGKQTENAVLLCGKWVGSGMKDVFASVLISC
jgi:hypothetical protein